MFQKHVKNLQCPKTPHLIKEDSDEWVGQIPSLDVESKVVGVWKILGFFYMDPQIPMLRLTNETTKEENKPLKISSPKN